MAIKPILFNAEMVRAILDGRKTCTRRLVKFLPGENSQWTGYIKDGLMLYNGRNEPCIRKVPYQPGDIMYVRETWQCWRAHRYEATADIRFRAGGDDVRLQFANGNTDSIDRLDYDTFVHKWFSHNGEWKPSLFMPKEAARIWLKVTDVRVERLKDITEDGALREGSQGIRCNHVALGEHGCTDCMNTGWIEPPQVEFMQIWNSTIKKSDIDRYGWDANPWVWVIEFERCEKPEGV